MAWHDSEPELIDMRRIFARFGTNMDSLARIAFAKAAIRSMLGAAKLRIQGVALKVVLDEGGSFRIDERPLLVFGMTPRGHIFPIFLGNPEKLKLFVQSDPGPQLPDFDNARNHPSLKFNPRMIDALRREYQYLMGDNALPIDPHRRYAVTAAIDENNDQIRDDAGVRANDRDNGGGHGDGPGDGGNDGANNGAGGPPDGGGNRPGAPDGPDGDGVGGLVEVISHPILFSVSAGDYQSLLDNY